MGFITASVKRKINGEIRYSVSYKIILEQREERKSTQLLNGTTRYLFQCILETKVQKLEKG